LFILNCTASRNNTSAIEWIEMNGIYIHHTAFEITLSFPLSHTLSLSLARSLVRSVSHSTQCVAVKKRLFFASQVQQNSVRGFLIAQLGVLFGKYRSDADLSPLAAFARGVNEWRFSYIPRFETAYIIICRLSMMHVCHIYSTKLPIYYRIEEW